MSSGRVEVDHRRPMSRQRRGSPNSANSTCRGSRSASRHNICCSPCSATTGRAMRGPAIRGPRRPACRVRRQPVGGPRSVEPAVDSRLARRHQGGAQHLISGRRWIPEPAALRPDPHACLRQAGAGVGWHVDDGGVHGSAKTSAGCVRCFAAGCSRWALRRCTTACGCRLTLPTTNSTSLCRSLHRNRAR